MMKRITAFLVSLSIAAPAVLPAQPAFAGQADTRTFHEAQVIQAGYRRWRDGDRRADRHEYRRDWRHDGRRDGGWRDNRHRYHEHRYSDRRYYDRRYDNRRYYNRYYYDRRRDGHRHHDNDAAYILGGLALGAIVLYGIFESGNRDERGSRY